MKEFEKYRSESLRLPGYDYSMPGDYFITICTKDRECLFSEIMNSKMVLNDFGKIVREEWLRTTNIRKEIILDEFIVMPNHIHGIITITDFYFGDDFNDVATNGRSSLQMKPKSISSFVAGFKSTTTKQINEIRETYGEPLWQRNYWEHIIRSEKSLDQIRDYIISNPAMWDLDRNNPDNF